MSSGFVNPRETWDARFDCDDYIFGTAPNERLLLLNVQAHGIRDGAIGDNPLLDEGGQLIFLSKITTADGNDDGQ